jgi:hypothetical protein
MVYFDIEREKFLKNIVINIRLYSYLFIYIWQPDAYCMCHISFVHHHLSLLFPVDDNLHVSLSISNTQLANLYIVKMIIHGFCKSIKILY